jgi:DNA-binding LytR/AlgR family response regulator
MLRCIAIDDEPLALELLVDNISNVPYLHLVASCSNPLEAMPILQQQPVDLIFLISRCPASRDCSSSRPSPLNPCSSSLRRMKNMH